MTELAISLGWNWLLVPALIWFLRGVWIAWTRPRLKYRSHSKVKSGYLLNVTRQELLPPWRSLEETYLIPQDASPCRDGDGWTVPRYGDYKRDQGAYETRLRGCLAAAIARDEETEEYTKL